MAEISVIVPTYNSPDSLNLCLTSLVEGQVNVNNEIIVVVDGTRDINQHIIDKWSNKVNFLILDENNGLPRATNIGVYNASNEQILIINDDNVAQKGWDVKLLQALKTHGKLAVISPNQVEPYPSMFRQFVEKDLGTDPTTFSLQHFWDFCDEIPSKPDNNQGSTLPIFINKNMFISLGGWDENFPTTGVVADWDFFVKCNMMGLQMVRVYDCNFYHFVSLSTNKTSEQQIKRQNDEQQGHEYALFKWGKYIKHNIQNNLKTI